MTDDLATAPTLDTTIAEPPLAATEAQMAVFLLERSRGTFAWKCADLDADGLHRRQPPSTLTLARLLKHLAFVEDERRTLLEGGPLGAPWEDVPKDRLFEWVFTSADDDDPATLYRLWTEAAGRTRATLARLLETGDLDQPSAYVLPDGRAVPLRRMVADLHDEYARHVGHADLLREAVDGRVGEDPPQP